MIEENAAGLKEFKNRKREKKNAGHRGLVRVAVKAKKKNRTLSRLRDAPRPYKPVTLTN